MENKAFELWDFERKEKIIVEARREGKSWKALCPWHDDTRPSLQLYTYEKRYYCHSCKKTGPFYDSSLDPHQKEKTTTKAHRNPDFVFDYQDEKGELVYQVLRYSNPKDFKVRRENPNSKYGDDEKIKWIWNLDGVDPILYRLPELIKGSDPVFIPEGESHVDKLIEIGLTATCNPFGAGKWRPELYNKYLKGRCLVILKDNDKPGDDHGNDIARSNLNDADWIKIPVLPGLPERGDVLDWLKHEGTKEQLLEIVKQTDVYKHSANNLESNNGMKINYRLTTLKDIFEYPEPTFLIDPILVEGTVSAIGAYTGTGKSVTALSIEKAILSKQPLWGKYPVLKTGPVLLMDEETPKGFLKERIKKMGFSTPMPLYFLHFQDVRLDKDECFNALMSKIEEVKPVLVVIDSLIRVHRQKEDDATSMSKVVDRLRKIANWGTTVLIIHHHKKGEGLLSQMLRGSSDIPGGIDIEYALIPKDGFLHFSSVKTRTKPLDPIKLKMEITESSIEMVYAGTEAEEVLTEVLDVLRNKGRLGVNEIWEQLKAREFEIGINRLREVLKNAIGKEIQGEQEKGRGKRWVFWLSDSSLFTSLYSTVKREETTPNSPDSSRKATKEEMPREETGQLFQGDSDSSQVKKHGVREELEDKDGYEVMDDGQRTY